MMRDPARHDLGRDGFGEAARSEPGRVRLSGGTSCTAGYAGIDGAAATSR